MNQAERDFRNQQVIAELRVYTCEHCGTKSNGMVHCYRIEGLPQPKVPETGLKPKKAQTNKPTLLEVYEEEVKQPKLF
jgi:tRNA-binding EMAP/Myf-like protein